MMETHVAVAVRGSHHRTTAIMLKLEKYVVIFFLSQYSSIQDDTFILVIKKKIR